MRPSPPINDGLGDLEQVHHLEERLDDLIALGSEEKIAAMVHRLADQLQAVVSSEGEWSGSEVHRLVGLAGILGFSKLEQTWRPVESRDRSPEEVFAARSAATAVIVFSERWRTDTQDHKSTR